MKKMLIVVLMFTSSLFFHGGIAATTDYKTDPIEVEALDTILQNWKIQFKGNNSFRRYKSSYNETVYWNINATNPCTGFIVDDSDDQRVSNRSSSNGKLDILCSCTKNITSSICNIIRLSAQNLNIFGTIPVELQNFTKLVFLYLGRNNFDGSLPSEIGNLKNMQGLDLSFNKFGGKLPDILWNLTKLKYLILSRNNFNGLLPLEIGNLKNMQSLSLWDNKFEGKVPDTLGNLTKLNYLDLEVNSFEGSIPSNIGNLVNLTTLYLATNNFEGKVPNSLRNLTKLRILSLSNIKFGGEIPVFLWNLKKMKDLYLRNCSLIGLLSDDLITKPTLLESLDLGFNKLSGDIPSSIFNIPRLKSLSLNNNKFHGVLPDKKSDNLTTIDLSNNDLEGKIPQWNGVILNLVNNKFSFVESQKIQPRGLGCLQQLSKCFAGKDLFTSFAINCGGEKMESADGKTIFEADDIINNNNASYYVADNNRWAVTFGRQQLINSTKNITNAQDPKLYRSARTSKTTIRYYGLGLKTGNYTVDLMFVYIDDDKYKFDIYIQGMLKDVDFEILKQSEVGIYKTFTKRYAVPVTNNTNNIEISFYPKYNSKVLISAIKVTPNFKVVGIEKNGSTKRSASVIGASVGVLVFILSCIVGYYLWKRHRKYRDEGNIELNGLEVNTYRFLELNTATENFNPANKLGEGGFGVVYKGTLYNGDMVAVKKLLAESIQGNEQFIAEVATISEVRQKNLVKLHGCCCQGNNRMLVYEYMENGSLNTALHGKTRQLDLDWDIRFTICLGIAKGLNYLHQYSRHRIIHRDIKSSNILLDQHLNPKISDFGLAKLFEDKMTHISTRAAGTYGYLAPEYALKGHLTEKVDVFAFGVVALEIISGKRCIDDSFASFGSNQTYIIEWAWNIHEKMDNDLAMVDPKLKSFNKEEVCRIIQVALLCTQMDSMSRPSMSNVIAMLNGEKDIGTLPCKPSYLMFWHDDGSSRAASSSIDIEFHSPPEIYTCSYSQSMSLQHAHRGHIN